MNNYHIFYLDYLMKDNVMHSIIVIFQFIIKIKMSQNDKQYEM